VLQLSSFVFPVLVLCSGACEALRQSLHLLKGKTLTAAPRVRLRERLRKGEREREKEREEERKIRKEKEERGEWTAFWT